MTVTIHKSYSWSIEPICLGFVTTLFVNIQNRYCLRSSLSIFCVVLTQRKVAELVCVKWCTWIDQLNINLFEKINIVKYYENINVFTGCHCPGDFSKEFICTFDYWSRRFFHSHRVLQVTFVKVTWHVR